MSFSVLYPTMMVMDNKKITLMPPLKPKPRKIKRPKKRVYNSVEEEIEHQKYIADKILNTFPEKYYNVLIAGGAPRDWYLNKPAKDLDVYIQTVMDENYREKEESLDIVLDSLGGVYIRSEYRKFNDEEAEEHGEICCEEEEANPYAEGEITTFLEYNIEGMKVEFMFIEKHPKDYILENFDISLCNIHYNKEGIQASHDFIFSLVNKTIYCYGGDNRVSKDNHKERVVKKFPDFKWDLYDSSFKRDFDIYCQCNNIYPSREHLILHLEEKNGECTNTKRD